jgi:MFS family permease
LIRGFDPHIWEVLRQPGFRQYLISRACTAVSNTLFQAATLWEVYNLTGSAAQLALVGVTRFVPALIFNLVGGAVADTYNRRLIMTVAQGAMLASVGLLAAAMYAGSHSVELLYVVSLINAIAQSFDNPARQSLMPQIVSNRLYPSAMVFVQITLKLFLMAGPSLGGFLIWADGARLAYLVFCVFTVASIATLNTMRIDLSHKTKGKGVNLAAIREGLSFVIHRKVVLGAMILDLVAVVFGGAQALLPIYARDILNAGPQGYGILATCLQVGALTAAFSMMMMPRIERLGVALVGTVVIYGLATIAFGFSTSMPLAMLFYALTGAADQVSVVVRQTMIQLSTPDELRGRVTSVNSIFTQSSTHVGAIESGIVAEWGGAVFSVVSGGFAVLAVTGVVVWALPELARHRLSHTLGSNPRSQDQRAPT